MLQNIKANIISQNMTTPNKVKINRRRISSKEVYEIYVSDFCRLVDYLTKGQFIKYVCYNIHNDGIYTVDPNLSMYKMMGCILDKLQQTHIKQIFGNDCDIDSIEKFVLHMSKCKWYTRSFVELTIKSYIKENYVFVNNSFVRKIK